MPVVPESYGEGSSNSCTVSDGVNSIDAFLSSAKPISEGGKGGFYIGRYEQGIGNVCKASTDAYVNLTRDEAKQQAEIMYNENSYVTSQLISSYAWDTALNFICQTNTEGYLLAMTTDSNYGNINTGDSGKTQSGRYTTDKYSNIYDLLGNCYEWTTEVGSNISNMGIVRGGVYNSSEHYASIRLRT